MTVIQTGLIQINNWNHPIESTNNISTRENANCESFGNLKIRGAEGEEWRSAIRNEKRSKGFGKSGDGCTAHLDHHGHAIGRRHERRSPSDDTKPSRFFIQRLLKELRLYEQREQYQRTETSMQLSCLSLTEDSLGFFGILWDSLGFLGVLEWCLMIEWTIIPHQWCETSISLYVSMPGFFWASKDWDSCCLLYRLISFPLPFQDPFWFAEVLGSYRGLQGCFCDNWWQSSIDPTVSMNGKKHHWLEILSDLQGTFEIWNYLGSPFIQHQCDQWSETSISSISSILPFPESFLDSQEFFERPSSLASNYSEMIQIRTDSKYASRVGRDFSPDSRKSNSLHSKVTFFEALKDTSSYVINCSNNQSEELFRNNPLHQTYHQTSLIQQLQLNLYLVDLIDCINPDMD